MTMDWSASSTDVLGLILFAGVSLISSSKLTRVVDFGDDRRGQAKTILACFLYIAGVVGAYIIFGSIGATAALLVIPTICALVWAIIVLFRPKKKDPLGIRYELHRNR
jgi:hypothetical protein